MPLAQLNISIWKIDPASERAKGFVDNVPRINALAERSPGFIWRLVDEARDKDGRNPVCADHNTLMTLSVWESAEHLEHFVWNTIHKQIYNRRAEWFDLMDSHHMVMWNIEKGHVPGLKEARDHLDHLDRYGDTDIAFSWTHLPHMKLWQKQRCS